MNAQEFLFLCHFFCTGEVIGVCAATIHHEDLVFLGIYCVKEKYRGSGIGFKVSISHELFHSEEKIHGGNTAHTWLSY